MDQQSQAQFKALLMQRKAELQELADEASDAAGTVVLDQTSVGRLSRMDALQKQQMALETDRRRQVQSGQIAAALNRIENDDYGYCETCGDAIPTGRLSIDPATRFCVNCSDQAR